MKKLAIALIPTALILTACGSSDTTPEVITEPTLTDVRQNEAQYIALITTEGNAIIDSGTTDQLLEIGWSICTRLTAGESIQSVGADLRDATSGSQQSIEAAAILMAGAVTALCNEQYDSAKSSLG